MPAREVSLFASPHCSWTVWGRSWSTEARLLKATFLLLRGFAGAAPSPGLFPARPFPLILPLRFSLTVSGSGKPCRSWCCPNVGSNEDFSPHTSASKAQKLSFN